ncbi:pentatricopeptide repeat-containing protein At4g39530-like [Punica granatum]|uniref:Uncharacterized protein n=2 Tax=Punica granatum TaxID=22663 RepID=A0A218XLD9_PUNGR|nr:pentatricopeptide repeat-containing protein At4g39530-like [Punica granatum]OWM85291.1 hypothetical protein CDL15_Pgr028078 [Punica granatum]PKI50927.1 hypothetical protein CRG98_028657 [Punica granatum]
MLTQSPHSPQLHGNVTFPPNRCPLARQTLPAGPRAAADIGFGDTLDSLTSCAMSRDLRTGSVLRGLVIKSGFGADAIAGNSLANMYSKCELLDRAKQVFEEMPHRTVVSWTTLMSGYCSNWESHMAISLFGQMLGEVELNEFTISVLLKACAQCANTNDHQRLVEAAHCYVVKYGLSLDSFLANSLVDSYAKCGKLSDAEKVLQRSGCTDVVSWTSLISGAVLNGYAREALSYFFRMQEDGKTPNEITVLSLLRACSLIGELEFFRWVHGAILKTGWGWNDFVVNSLMELYLVNGCFLEGIEVFCKFLSTSEDQHVKAETLALILQGCSELGLFGLGKQIHCFLIKCGIIPLLVIENSLVDMYSKNECIGSAVRLFSRMANRDIVSWNTIITCLVRRGDYSRALSHFREIHRERGDGESGPDFVTMLAVLQACSDMGSYRLGQVIHGFITKTGFVCDTFVQNSLIDMYGKTGRLDSAHGVFKEMLSKDISSWNSMIGAFGVNGNGHSAMTVFRELTRSGIEQPNEITFVNILSACDHAGIMKEGLEIFNCIESVYGTRPSTEHLACVVDMLGRSGRLDEAEAFIRNVPIKPDRAAWGALLSSCCAFGRVDLAERAARELSVLDWDNKAWRVAMSNIYAGVGRWEDVAKVRLEMKELNGKEAAWSSVEVHGQDIAFMVNDTTHPECASIYETLHSITGHIAFNSTA